MQWVVPGAIIVAAIFISISIRDAGRWQIASSGGNPYSVYRIDRWTGKIQYCTLDTSDPVVLSAGIVNIVCQNNISR